MVENSYVSLVAAQPAEQVVGGPEEIRYCLSEPVSSYDNSSTLANLCRIAHSAQRSHSGHCDDLVGLL